LYVNEYVNVLVCHMWKVKQLSALIKNASLHQLPDTVWLAALIWEEGCPVETPALQGECLDVALAILAPHKPDTQVTRGVGWHFYGSRLHFSGSHTQRGLILQDLRGCLCM